MSPKSELKKPQYLLNRERVRLRILRCFGGELLGEQAHVQF